MRVNPCIKCADRSAECHATCERYQTWLEEHIEHKHEIKKQKKPEIFNYIVERRYRGKNNDQR